MKKILFLLLCTFITHQLNAQTMGKGLEEAYLIQKIGGDFATQNKALEKYEEVAKKYPNEWLPTYWAAFISVSIARIVEDDVSPQYLKRGMDHFNTAKKIGFDKHPSEFKSLEGFILSIHSMYAEGDERDELRSNMRKALNESVKLSVDNPITFIFQGMSLSVNAMSEGHLSKLASGRSLLLNAKKDIEARTSKVYLSPYFNYDMVDAFIPRVDSFLLNN